MEEFCSHRFSNINKNPNVLFFFPQELLKLKHRRSLLFLCLRNQFLIQNMAEFFIIIINSRAQKPQMLVKQVVLVLLNYTFA